MASTNGVTKTVNETIELIRRRRSQRAYADKPIGAEERAMIVESAIRAPTAGNMMLYSILEVTDPGDKRRLVKTCSSFLTLSPS